MGMNNWETKIDGIKKGCGYLSKGNVKGLTCIMKCGETGFKDKFCLCEVCRAKLTQLQEDKTLHEQELKSFAEEEVQFLEHLRKYLNNSVYDLQIIKDRIKLLSKRLGKNE